MLNNDSKLINNVLIQKIGLELDDQNHLIDQDTGQPLHFNGKIIKYNHTNINRLAKNEVEFDPLNNTSMANYLCGYYIEKMNAEEETDINIYSQSNKDRDTPGIVEARQNDMIIKSDTYVKDSLKYIDLINKIDNSIQDLPLIGISVNDINLHEFDIKEKPKKRR